MRYVLRLEGQRGHTSAACHAAPSPLSTRLSTVEAWLCQAGSREQCVATGSDSRRHSATNHLVRRLSCDAGRRSATPGDHEVELGGIEPPSIRRCTARDTTIPDFETDAVSLAGRLANRYRVALEPSFRPVTGLPRRQWSFPPSSSASVAGLRTTDPVRHFWSRCLFTFLKDQAARANCSLAILVCAPFSESEQLGSHARPED